MLPYSEFLKSQYWLEVRDEIKKRAKNRCELCAGRSRLEVHHKTYQNHGYEHSHPEDLICLCSSCHSKFHDKLRTPNDPIPIKAPEEPMPAALVSKRKWAKRNMRAWVIPSVLRELIALDEPGGQLRYVPRIVTRVANALDLPLLSVTTAIRDLERRGMIYTDSVGITLKVTKCVG